MAKYNHLTALPFKGLKYDTGVGCVASRDVKESMVIRCLLLLLRARHDVSR